MNSQHLTRHQCRSCGRFEFVKGGNHNFKCSSCWMPDSEIQAMQAVCAALLKGDIPHPATLKCADCDSGASMYDHRDYNRPLMVEPVCFKCNSKRGPAFPVFACMERKVAKGRPPYRNAKAVRQLCALLGAHEVAHGLKGRVDAGFWHQAWPRMKAAHAFANGAA